MKARVIAISEGIVYEVVNSDIPVEPIYIPIYETQDDSPKPQINDAPVTLLPDFEPQPTQNIGTGMEVQHPDDQLEAEKLPCLGGLLPLFLLPLAVIAFRIENE